MELRKWYDEREDCGMRGTESSRCTEECGGFFALSKEISRRNGIFAIAGSLLSARAGGSTDMVREIPRLRNGDKVERTLLAEELKDNS